MSRRTRYFLVGAGLVLVVSLGTGLVAYYSGGLRVGSSSDQQELNYIPADATVVAYANVHEVMNSEFRQHLKQAIPDGDARQALQEQTGIDLERDIDSVTAALETETHNQGPVVLVRGVIDQPRIEALATQHGGTVEEYGGKRLIRFERNGGPGCLAFLEPGLVALGDESTVKRAIDAPAHGAVSANADMMKLVRDVEGPAHTAWAVGRLDALSNSGVLPEPVKSQLPAVQWFAVSTHVDGGVSGNVRVEARDEQSADNLRAVINGGLALARMQTGHDSKLDAILNSVQSSGTGTTIQVSFSLPPDVLDVVNGIAGLANLNHPIKR